MKNISIRITAIIFGIALAWAVMSCAGRITVGDLEEMESQSSPKEQLQALIEQAQVPEDISEVPGEEADDKFPNVQLKGPNLDPRSNTWAFIHGFKGDENQEQSPNLIASADFSSNMYKDNAADSISELLKKILDKYGVSFDNALVAVFYKSPTDNYPASWLVAFKGVDVKALIEKMEPVQNNLYKDANFYLAEIEGIKLIGSKDYVTYGVGYGFNVISTYLEAYVAPFRLISDSPKLVEKVFGFLEPVAVEKDKPLKDITSINAKYFADKKEIELTANYYLYQINQATAVFKFDSLKFDWKRFAQMLGEFIGVEKKTEIIKDEAANVSPEEQDALKYDQMNLPTNVSPGEANY